MMNANVRPVLAALMAMASPITANTAKADAPPQDMFTGMVSSEAGQFVLDRCDVGATRYLLRAANGATDVFAPVRGKTGIVQATAIASFSQENGRSILTVATLEDIQVGHSCRLADAVDTAEIAGHYYLSGVMETGSELQLGADGKFEWYISYGAVDLTAKGHWSRTGQTITLVSDKPDLTASLFSLDERSDWTEQAERRLFEQRAAQAEAAIDKRCPWRRDTETDTVSTPRMDEPATPQPHEIARAEASKRQAVAARDAAGAKIAAAMRGGANDDDRAAADAAVIAWENARSAMVGDYFAVGQEVPDLGKPLLPAACESSPSTFDAQIQRDRWQRGIAVVVGDPAYEARFSQVSVEFHFTDGIKTMAQTDNGGWAITARRPGLAVDRIDLTLPEPPLRQQTLPLPPLTEGIQAVKLDARQLMPIAFETMRLTISPDGLIPQDMPKGRYTRQ